MKTRNLSLVGVLFLMSANLFAAESRGEPAGYRVKLHLPPGTTLENYRAPAGDRTTELVYVTFDKKGNHKHTARISASAWQGETLALACSSSSSKPRKFTDGMRFECLKNIFFAMTKEKSKSNLRHLACYNGDPVLLAYQFFENNPDIKHLDRQTGIDYTTSDDGYAIGVEANFLKMGANGNDLSVYFRLPACDAPGKMNILPKESDPVRSPSSKKPETFVALTDREKSALRPLVDAPELRQEGRSPQSDDMKYGFMIGDSIRSKGDEEKAKKLERFVLMGDYEKAQTAWKADKDAPWRGLDISKPEDQKKFSLLMLDYAYEGMVNQHKNWKGKAGVAEKDRLLYAQSNDQRYWCHMPWLNGDNTGREVIHGLTKERDLEPSPMFPNATPGSDWGIGFYNAKGCIALQNVFGTKSAPKAEPDYSRVNHDGQKAIFPDGSVAVKFLFTTAKFDGLNGTHVMLANVSKEKGKTARSIQDVSLVQIDIAVKDSKMKGTRKELDHWVMTTYYFDPAYDFGKEYPAAKTKGYLPGFMKMRPQGAQIGLGLPPTDSTVFAGALPNGLEGRLNGPADNPKGSCLGCHATAGTKTGMVPGFLTDAAYQAQAAGSLEFSQQLALARRNSQTKPKWVVNQNALANEAAQNNPANQPPPTDR